jgi:hypothetical protein
MPELGPYGSVRGGHEVTRVPTAIIRPFYPSSDRGEDIARGPVRLTSRRLVTADGFRVAPPQWHCNADKDDHD